MFLLLTQWYYVFSLFVCHSLTSLCLKVGGFVSAVLNWVEGEQNVPPNTPLTSTLRRKKAFTTAWLHMSVNCLVTFSDSLISSECVSSQILILMKKFSLISFCCGQTVVWQVVKQKYLCSNSTRISPWNTYVYVFNCKSKKSINGHKWTYNKEERSDFKLMTFVWLI